MVNVSLVWDHRNRTKVGHEGPIEVRVTVNRKVRYVATGVRVLKQNWKHGVVVDRYDCEELNGRLQLIMKRVQRTANEAMDAEGGLDMEDVRKDIQGVLEDVNDCAFLDWLEEEVPKLQLAPGTRRHYNAFMIRMCEYGKIASWRDLTPENIIRFDEWLHQRTNADGEHIGDAAVWNYHKRLRRMLGRAVKLRKIDRNPYDFLKGEFDKGMKESVEYLTEDEMVKIRDARLPMKSAMDKVRDLFVFQMYTGMAYADMVAFRIEDYKLVDGKWIKNSERIKTGQVFVSQLLPPVVAVLEKWEFKLPIICNVDYNRMLKILQERLEIPTTMHSHLARHTFATYMLNKGVPVHDVQKMLGHSDIKMTMRYAKVLAKSVHESFERVAKSLR